MHDVQLEVRCFSQLLAPVKGGGRTRGAGGKGQGWDVPRWVRSEPQCYCAGQTDRQQRCEAPGMKS